MPYKNVEFRRAYDRERNKHRKYQAPKTRRVRRQYLTEQDYKRIKILDGYMSMTDIARRFGISYWTVRDIISGRSKPWKPSGCIPTAEKQR